MPRSPFTKEELYQLFQDVVLNEFHIRLAKYTFRQNREEIATTHIIDATGQRKELHTRFYYFDVKIQGVSESLFDNNFEGLNIIREAIRKHLRVKSGRILKMVGTPNKRFVYIQVEFKSDEEVDDGID